jgi:hypothetical protein
LNAITYAPFVKHEAYEQTGLTAACEGMNEPALLRRLTALLEHQRRNFYRSPKGEPFSGVGGYALATTGEPLTIDDKIFLATSRPPFGGLRWWFVCPHLNRRVRKLYLPRGGRHFWSRRAYELAYSSQRETNYDRTLRRARKLRLKLGGDPADDEYPDKPPRMRWATYNRLMDRLVAADGVAEERLKAARLLWATA